MLLGSSDLRKMMLHHFFPLLSRECPVGFDYFKCLKDPDLFLIYVQNGILFIHTSTEKFASLVRGSETSHDKQDDWNAGLTSTALTGCRFAFPPTSARTWRICWEICCRWIWQSASATSGMESTISRATSGSPPPTGSPSTRGRWEASSGAPMEPSWLLEARRAEEKWRASSARIFH